MISIIVVVVLGLALLFFLWKSTETWSWTQIIFTFLIFCLAIPAAIYSAQVFKARSAWYKQYAANKASFESAEKRLNEVMYGPPNSIAFSDRSLVGLNQQLRQEMIGTGRTWYNKQAAKAGNNIEVTMASPVEASQMLLQEGEGAELDTLVYVFVDTTQSVTYRDLVNDADASVEAAIPHRFVGSFLVTAINGATITLQPQLLTEFGRTEATAPSATWSLFEQMPLDRRDVFKSHAGIMDETAYEDTDDNGKMRMISDYRNLLTSTYLPADILGYDLTVLEDQKKYEELIDSYNFDGLPLNDIQSWIQSQNDRVGGPFDPEPYEKRVRLRWTANSNRSFEVDAEGSTDSGMFQDGKSVDPLMKHGGPITPQNGQEFVFDYESAVSGYRRSKDDMEAPLIETEAANVEDQPIETYYTRPLNDYPFILKELAEQKKNFDNATRIATEANSSTVTANEESSKQQSSRQSVKSFLETDQQNLQADKQVIEQYVQQLEAEVNRLNQRLDTSYKQMLQLKKQMEQSENTSFRGTNLSSSR